MMKNSIKGAVFSGLVFPGLGQVVLRHYKRGVALALAVTLSLLVVVVKALRQAFAILEKIEAEGRVIDMSTISSVAAQTSTTSDSLVYNVVLLLIILLWILGIVDAYRLGRKKDLEERSTRFNRGGQG
jgi:beta-lactamase regulating signal transducer with metallopeptidase domain